MTESKKNLIRSIYFYAFAGIGLIMVIIGAFQLVQFGSRKFLLKQYYLDYSETRCDFLSTPVVTGPDGKMLTVEQQTAEQARVDSERKRCEASLEVERQSRQVTDLTSAITLFALGGAVFVFHYRRTKSD